MKKLTKKEMAHCTTYQCLNEKCGRQIAAVDQLMFCPVCEAGALEVIENILPF